MRRTYLFIWAVFLFILSPMLSKAQNFVENYWHDGKTLTNDGDTLKGKLKFSLDNEVLQIETRKGLITLTPRKILTFQFYDRRTNRERSYYTLPYPKVDNYPTPTFFELLYQAEYITLLCRERLETQTLVNNNPYTLNPRIPITRTYVKSEFFFLYKNGKIKPFNGTRKGLLYLLNDREKDIKDFLRENRIDLDNKSDMISIIDFYNSKKY